MIAYTSEFRIKACDGQHAITANVDIPEKEEKAVLEFSTPNATALDDILLLLSLFTGRDVFTFERRDEREVITADPREYPWGGILVCSIPYRASGEMSDEDALRGVFPFDIGREEGLNAVYSVIRTDEWLRKYERGYFLFLARQAFHAQPLESAFVQCWTIWEHLFAVLNPWLSALHARRLESAEKIAFILMKFALCPKVDGESRARIVSLAEIRNALVHSGRFPERTAVYDDAILFNRLTEFVIAKILGLRPSNLFNTVERLEEFLRKERPQQGRGKTRSSRGSKRRAQEQDQEGHIVDTRGLFP